MATITRTFGATLTSAYVPVSSVNPTIEVLHLRDMVFDADEQLAIYLDTAQAIIDIGSFNIAKIPNLDGDESTVEEALALSKAESESNKIGLRILTRKNNTGNWSEIAEFILLNYGRKDYLDLRTKTGFPARLLEKNDAIAIQLVDYGDGLLWDTDTIAVNFALSIEIEKKNNVDALTARISALELALEGRLINLPANTILGRDTTAGTVQQIPQSRFVTPAEVAIAINALTGNSSTALDTLAELGAALANDANFAATVTNALSSKVGKTGNETIAGEKTFTTALLCGVSGSVRLRPGDSNNSGYLEIIRGNSIRNGYIGFDNVNMTYVAENGAQHTFIGSGINVYGNTISFNGASEGTFLGLFKELNSLPGYPTNRHPTVKTDFSHIYFSAGGLYSASINSSGVFTSISDKNRKENLRQVNNEEILNLLLNIPIYTYNFKNSDTRIRNLGCMAQDFYSAFGLGGDVEIENDSTPITPSKMIATADLVGVCLASIKALAKQVASLKKT